MKNKINNINNLNLKELQELRSIINKHISEDMQLKVINTIHDRYLKNRGFLLKMNQANYNKNNPVAGAGSAAARKIYVKEYICKGVYLPSIFVDYIHLSKIRSLLDFSGNLYNTVIKCCYDTEELQIHEIYKGQYYIRTGITNFNKIIPHLNKNNLSETIFIFSNINYDLIVLLLSQIRVLINGGSHNKRHLIQPLELEVIKIMETLYDFVASEGSEYSSELMAPSSNIFKDESKKIARLYQILKDSYYSFDNVKTRNDEDYKNKLRNFYRFWELAYNNKYNKSYLEALFLYLFYISEIQHENIIMKVKDSFKEKFSKILILVNNRINEMTINSTNISHISKSISNRREYHTMIRSYSTSTKISRDLVKISPEKVKFYDAIKEIINNGTDSYKAQYDIETTWNSINIENHQNLDYLKKHYSNSFISKLFKAKETLDALDKNKTIKKRFPTISPYINDYKILLITYGVALNGVNMKLGYNNICSLIGKKVIYQIFLLYLKNSINLRNHIESENSLELINYFSSENKDINQFLKIIKLTDVDYIKLGNFLLELLMVYPVSLFEKTFEDGIYEMAKLSFNEKNFDVIKENLIIDPASLPMLIEPIRWSDSEFGGYILNKYLKQDIITGSAKHGHLMKNRENLYKAVNKMSSIKFGFNNSLLNFLKNEGKYLLDNKDIVLTISERLQITNQMKIAEIYSQIPFYIPLRSDWRGRIYTQSFYANYQGSDLSLSLLEFWDGEPLNKKGLDSLYIYGANLYNENNLSKASYEDRVHWTLINKNNILSMNKDFMLKAENKFTFAAFCLIFKELEKDPNYIVKFPVFLDATCSGIQHLAALMKDCVLAKEVNLIPKEEGLNIPADIYETLRKPINDEITRVGLNDPLYPNLQYVKLSRSEVKQPIMTKTYNVTTYGVKEQLIAKFKDGKVLKASSIFPDKKVILNKIDVLKIANIIYNSIFNKYPGLNLIYNYFIEMAKLLSKLNLPIVWSTPSGLEITQKYYSSKEMKISINLGGKSSKLVLKEMTDNIDTRKQNSAIIPNVIHSLDSNHVAYVINDDFGSILFNKPIITIHDCFGTHPNYMEDLSDIVKLNFIKLYSSESFLEKFHNRNLQSIQDYGYKIELDTILDKDYVIYKTRSKIYIPNLPKLGKLDLWKIKDSKYFIT